MMGTRTNGAEIRDWWRNDEGGGETTDCGEEWWWKHLYIECVNEDCVCICSFLFVMHDRIGCECSYKCTCPMFAFVFYYSYEVVGVVCCDLQSFSHKV